MTSHSSIIDARVRPPKSVGPSRARIASMAESRRRGKMELTADVRTVLDIVRRVLRARTDWITQGQVLMEAIVSEVEKHPARTP
jgi:hypothetical protein